ncbi:MAG: polyprenyl diphosphate synthase [Candidatus Saccharibacteria bacterium]|nr:polyprenyl diphosphate synthase [Candidatus Saccharibacteria bacterium]
MEDEITLPKHLGFIVDGNRRWAKLRNLPTMSGHMKGLAVVEELAVDIIKRGIPFASFYIFSNENWGRSEKEVNYLMDMTRKNLDRLAKRFKKENIKCVLMGRKEPIADDIWAQILHAEEITKDCTGGTIGLCFNYGGKQEIADAMTKILAENPGKTEVSVEEIEQNIYHPEVPSCDYIVRTSGEQRISGFMLWRAAYAEFCFYEKLFPDLKPEDLDNILEDYASRQRRYGK